MFKNKYIVSLVLIILISAAVFIVKGREEVNREFIIKEVHPIIGDIRLTVATTGVVEPQNRLEIKPSINGRIEEISVKEGDKVKKGEVLAFMSSTERAALVDASRSQGEELLKYWEDVYKQSPIISPIAGEVIVRSVEPGQTVTTNDAVLVLSDRLIISAQFDETDIGRVKIGQEALIALDAYPSVKIRGIIDHIAYESKLVNNVNIYDVDIVPEKIPDFCRSGMSANVEVIEKERKGVLLIPSEAIEQYRDETFVTVKTNPDSILKKRKIEVGLNDEKNTEVTSGLTTADIIVVEGQIYSPQKKESGTNPFMPFRGKKK